MKKTVLMLMLAALCLSASTGWAATKIGIMTGTVSQGEEEYRAGEEMLAKYGEDRVIHVTYPDKFNDEQETTITQVAAMAADPDVKAIVICQGVPGTAAAIRKSRELRDDLMFIIGTVQEEPFMMARLADILYEPDQPERGRSIAEKAKAMGAKTLVHYSFPRHMGVVLLAERRKVMEEAAKEIGLEFVFVNAPDPTGEGGVPAAQQFILEDVPRQIARYGKDTAFFSTNCSMQEPLIKMVMDGGAIYPEQCCPSPFHALPNALGIKVEKSGDVDDIMKKISAVVTEANMNGRVSTWKAPMAMSYIRAGAALAMDYAEGRLTNVKDVEAGKKALRDAAGEATRIRPYDEQRAANFLMVVGESVIF